VHIVETYGIFGNKTKAIKLCLNRFDTDTQLSFFDLYTKIDAGTQNAANTATVQPVSTTAEEIAF